MDKMFLDIIRINATRIENPIDIIEKTDEKPIEIKNTIFEENNEKTDKNIETQEMKRPTIKITKIYNQKKYNKTFIEKNKDKIKEKNICDICCGSYTYYNKSKHMKSQKHIRMAEKYK
jgi:hypothetical protein